MCALCLCTHGVATTLRPMPDADESIKRIVPQTAPVVVPVSAAAPIVADAVEMALVEKLKAGDAAAYERLVRDYGPRMLMVARRLLRGDAEAEEAVQEAFISAFKAMGRFEGTAKLSTWLHRITVNAALMRLRKAGRLRENSIDAMLPAFADDGHPARARAGANSVTAASDGAETREVVMAQINQLPDAYRAVIIMRDIDGLSTEQTAELLETTEAAVKVRLHRARQALRELLEPLMKEGRL